MAINSYFYDSVNSDRPYSAKDFATAFGIGFETGFLIREKLRAGGLVLILGEPITQQFMKVEQSLKGILLK